VRYKPFGKTGRNVSEVGIGTYYDPLWIAAAFLGWRRKGQRKVSAVVAGLEAGVNLIDTAEIYGSEPLVAKAIKGKKRDDLFVATKVWSNHLRRDAMVRSLERSLKRLELSYVDLYQVHFPNERVPIRETMSAMEDLVQSGKVVYLGVSNFSLGQIQEANAALRRYQLSSVQLPYNLTNRKVESDVLPYCQKEHMALMAYYPLAHGKLVSSEKLGSMQRKYDKTPSQLAIKWLSRQENVFPIPRASSAQHVTENAQASEFDLSGEDAAELERLFAE
jgi:diketogulonate reductase-like aldo/keto reductase